MKFSDKKNILKEINLVLLHTQFDDIMDKAICKKAFKSIRAGALLTPLQFYCLRYYGVKISINYFGK